MELPEMNCVGRYARWRVGGDKASICKSLALTEVCMFSPSSFHIWRKGDTETVLSIPSTR